MPNHKERKVFLLIVEGSSDRIAIKGTLKEVLKALGYDALLDCEVYGTDLTLHPYQNNNQYSEPEDALENVVSAVNEFIFNERRSSKIDFDNIAAVATLSDLDACYCDDSRIVFYSNAPKDVKSQCDINAQLIRTTNIPFMKKRNATKRDAFDTLLSEKEIYIGETTKRRVPFKPFYMSVHLEHALMKDTCEHTLEEKGEMARNFRAKYIHCPTEFIHLLDDISIHGTDHPSSWNRKTLKENAFARASNLFHIIQWFKELADVLQCSDVES